MSGTWEDVRRAYGSPATCWRRFRNWAAEGTWERIWRALLSQLNAQGKFEWAQAVPDGSFVPAKNRKVVFSLDEMKIPILRSLPPQKPR
jgi:hypothetical protein